MAVKFEINPQQTEIKIWVSGKLDFQLIEQFRDVYQAIESPEKVIIDLKQASYIDSSGLGILIYLRNHFACCRENISLINCNPQVAKTLTIASFKRMFTVTTGE